MGFNCSNFKQMRSILFPAVFPLKYLEKNIYCHFAFPANSDQHLDTQMDKLLY